jgi:hypothetical protein
MNKPFAFALTFLAASLSAAAVSADAIGHVADPLVIPVFKKKGEIHGRLGTGPSAAGFRAQGGVAMTGRVALVSGTSFSNQDECLSCNTKVQRHFEFGAGLFQPTETGWVREAYAGVGTGNFKASGSVYQWDPRPEDMRITSAQYDMAFVQGNLGHRGKLGDILYGLRMAGHHMRNVKVKDGTGYPLHSEASAYGLYLEPAVNGRVGFPNYKLDLQIGYSLPLRKAQAYDDTRTWVSLGLAFNALGH